ncbi:MAG: hypothetical protein GY830_07400 [Bacteroidetes bacterium]|nr:hypothetical protein [Bacteroidota bacterium]
MEEGYKTDRETIKNLFTKEFQCTNKETILAKALIQYKSGIDTLINYDVKFFSKNEESLFDIILEDCSVSLKVLKYFYSKQKD